jgi:Transposase DDE domain group 1
VTLKFLETINGSLPGTGYFSLSFQSTLRQRIDLIGESANTILKDASAEMVLKKAPSVSSIKTSGGYVVPLDIDVSPFDNSKTQKEKVYRTYKGFDGYAPILAYFGNEGYLINVELREGKQHCQKNTPEFIEETLKYARKITQKPILIRLDSGNDSQDNFMMGSKFPNIHFLVKRNLRKESLNDWLDLAKAQKIQRVVVIITKLYGQGRL